MSFPARVKDLWRQDPKRAIAHGLGWLLLVFLVLGGLSVLIPTQPRLIVSGQKQGLTKPLVVKFALPPDRDNIGVSLSPEIPVSVSWAGGFFGHLSRTMLITPETGWQADTEYVVNLRGVVGALGVGRVSDQGLAVATQGLPTVKKVSVAGAKAVSPEAAIEVQLSDEAENVADFFFELTPSHELTAELSGEGYVLNFAEPLKQGQRYDLVISRQLVVYDIETGEIERRLEKQVVSRNSFTTRAPALVKSFSPQGRAVLPSEKELKIIFSEAMNRQSVLERISLNPRIAGRWRWDDNQTLAYAFSGNLPIAAAYQVTLQAGAEALSGSFVEEDEVLSFSTVGALRVTGSSPANGQAGVGLRQRITISFDQPVKQDEAAAALSIEPNIKFSSSWSGNSLAITPTSPLDYSRHYSLTIKAGLGSVYGKPLAGDYRLSFSTELEKVVLNIPLDYQDRALSCEAAALKMALRYRGKNVSESDIMAIIGYDPTIKSGNTWGDPDKAFVGNIDGSQNSTGYGVHWEPIAKAASHWRPATAFSGWSAAKLAKAVEAGNPVVIWGTLGNAYFDPWYTPANRYVAAWKGEHARTVIGYVGSASNPASFIINDPIAGRITWSTATLLANWGRFNNSGVVVY